jgi:hypothetical protein
MSLGRQRHNVMLTMPGIVRLRVTVGYLRNLLRRGSGCVWRPCLEMFFNEWVFSACCTISKI